MIIKWKHSIARHPDIEIRATNRIVGFLVFLVYALGILFLGSITLSNNQEE